jgi:hypothetical protein
MFSVVSVRTNSFPMQMRQFETLGINKGIRSRKYKVRKYLKWKANDMAISTAIILVVSFVRNQNEKSWITSAVSICTHAFIVFHSEWARETGN